MGIYNQEFDDFGQDRSGIIPSEEMAWPDPQMIERFPGALPRYAGAQPIIDPTVGPLAVNNPALSGAPRRDPFTPSAPPAASRGVIPTAAPRGFIPFGQRDEWVDYQGNVLKRSEGWSLSGDTAVRGFSPGSGKLEARGIPEVREHGQDKYAKKQVAAMKTLLDGLRQAGISPIDSGLTEVARALGIKTFGELLKAGAEQDKPIAMSPGGAIGSLGGGNVVNPKTVSTPDELKFHKERVHEFYAPQAEKEMFAYHNNYEAIVKGADAILGNQSLPPKQRELAMEDKAKAEIARGIFRSLGDQNMSTGDVLKSVREALRDPVMFKRFLPPGTAAQMDEALSGAGGRRSAGAIPTQTGAGAAGSMKVNDTFVAKSGVYKDKKVKVVSINPITGKPVVAPI